MTSVPEAAGPMPAAASTSSGRALTLAGWGASPEASHFERAALAAQARDTDAARQLQRCFPRWAKALEHLSWRALRELAANRPVDPNDPDAWRTRDEAALGVLRRHGITRTNPGHLALTAITALIDGQAAADRAAGLDWTTLTTPANRLDEKLRRAHARAPIDLTDPVVFAHVGAQRQALAHRLGLPAGQADDLSRWALSRPEQFDPSDLRCWRIASQTWLALADEQLEPVEGVERPVGLFVAPALKGHGWQLTPVLSLDMVRLIAALGGRLERDLRSATLPGDRAGELLERVNAQTLHAGPKELRDAAGQLAQELTRVFGQTVAPGLPRDKRDRWGRLLAHRSTYTNDAGAREAQLGLRVVTFPAREFTQRRLGAAPRSDDRYAQPSATMELGEAIQTAVDPASRCSCRPRPPGS